MRWFQEEKSDSHIMAEVTIVADKSINLYCGNDDYSSSGVGMKTMAPKEYFIADSDGIIAGMLVVGIDNWRDDDDCGNISGHVDINIGVSGKMVMVGSDYYGGVGCVIGGSYWE